MDVPAGVTQKEGHAGFFIHLPSAVLALIFIATSNQPSLSLDDHEVEFYMIWLTLVLQLLLFSVFPVQ